MLFSFLLFISYEHLVIFSYLKRTVICDKSHCDCYHCAISVVMDPRNQKWLRHQMVILSSTRTRLMNFQCEIFLRTNERQISLSMYELPYPPHRKTPSPPTRILSYYVPTQSIKIGSSEVYNGIWLAHYLWFQFLNISLPLTKLSVINRFTKSIKIDFFSKD